MGVQQGGQNFVKESCMHAMKPITGSHGKETLLFSLTSPSMRTRENLIFTKSGLDSQLKMSPGKCLAISLCDKEKERGQQ